ncbi:conserved hypothetical protein [Desulfamplus magnetovallimortis]|uniref:DUF1778 domain-containing protein n=1 Tax=Desulfamplus magnetovallimortis TaxID=1246637 RepID=A0A1W1HA56_9BACT|nr:DUF1778 domain-containing protein [Desulfamplus magnetovallimortis]SLM29361.1 conserved hypothetical protein [Desulfamplus magnetovallimortis]
MATAHLNLMLDEKIKAKAEKASAILGLKSLTEYIVILMDKDATRVIDQHENIIIDNDIFDQFITACNKVKKPGKALFEAVAFSEENGF